MHNILTTQSKLAAMTISLLLLSACGGGDGDTSTNNPSNNPIKMSKSTLVATGITTCGNDLKNGLACDGLTGDWKGLKQDGEVKAGVTMQYKELSQSGSLCVEDVVTGLIWEQKTNDGGIHDINHTYSWYSDDKTINGGVAGTKDKGTCSIANGCDSQTFINTLNQQKYCGYSDWRLPTIGELHSLVDYSKRPAISTTFTHTPTDTDLFYWSSTLSSDEEGYENEYMWAMNFSKVKDSPKAKESPQLIRAVRSKTQ